MSIPGSAEPLLLAQQDTGGYQIQRSLRFNSSDSAYLSRTPASAGNRKTWTLSLWLKRTKLGQIYEEIISNTDSSTVNGLYCGFTGDAFQVAQYTASFDWNLITTQVFRDTSSWGHLLVAADTTQATASNRIKVYWNGVQITSFSTQTYPTQNLDINFNTAVLHAIGRFGSNTTAAYYANMCMADVHFIDGQALTPSSFTEVSATTGQLIPKQYTGSFGTNGFWLKFSDNSAATATTLGKDYSGNSNNWTPNNLSVTAGAGNDSLTDTPTSYGTGSSGGDVRGNFCTWNPLAKLGDITQTLNVSNGNLTFSGSSNIGTIGTIGMSSGKWYWELNCTSLTASQLYFGMTSVTTGSRTASFVGIRDTGVLSGSANGATTNGSGTTAFTTGDVVGFAYDADNKRLFVAKNNTWLNSADPAAGTNASFTDVQGSSLYPFISDNNTTATIDANWGARPFAYTAPSGFKALCDTNLPAPVVAKPNEVMDVDLYTGTSSSHTRTLGFSPDLVWIKQRGGATAHCWYDVQRGSTLALRSNLTNAEADLGSSNSVTFNSNGYTLGADSAGFTNYTGVTYVAWTWDAGSSTVTNTQGSITSQVRANASAGFSIVTWTGNGVGGATIGHGLNVAPSMIIIKQRDQADNWVVGHTLQGWSSVGFLNLTNAWGVISYFNNTAPSSTTFQVSGSAVVNRNGYQFVAYCFAPVAGYNSISSFVGNNSTDGTFVYTGHRVRWLLLKNATSAGTSWVVFDSARSSYNVVGQALLAHSSSSELSGTFIDFLSNGFKLRVSSDPSLNNNGDTYIYMAIAESPFQYARAR